MNNYDQTFFQIANGFMSLRARHKLCKDHGCSRKAVNGSEYCYLHIETYKIEGVDETGYSRLFQTIYFILAPDPGLIKIGITKNLKRRFAGIVTMSPVRLVLAATVDGPAKLEKDLHSALAPSRAHGEWFRPTDEVLSVVEQAQAGDVERIYSLLRSYEVANKR